MDLKEKKLGFLLTRKISLRTWDKVGNLEREILFYRKLASYFKEIYIFSYGDTRDLKYTSLLPENIKIIPKPKFIPETLYVFLMPIFHRKFFREIDIIKTNQMDGSWAGIIAKKLFKNKLVVRSGYEWLNFLIGNHATYWKINLARIVEEKAYRNADKIIITSYEDKKFIEDNFKTPKDKVTVIRNYIDTEKFKQSEGVSKNGKSILYIGRLEEDKNIKLLLKSLKGLSCELNIVGVGKLREEIENLGHYLGVKIHFFGRVSQNDLPNILNQNDIFVLPSKSEGNPKSLLEAMSSGLAVIGTNVKGIKEVIRDGENGLLADLSAESLREKILVLLENKDLCARLGSSARNAILEEYSLETLITKELEIYRTLYE
jgi:glycosyltransferase involved in cell wall biosynthesis